MPDTSTRPCVNTSIRISIESDKHQSQHPSFPLNFEGHNIRYSVIGNEIWFVATDVCKALGLKNTPKSVLRLDDDEVQVVDVSTITNSYSEEINSLQGSPNSSITIISEPGVYGLTFTSRKPEAKRFKRWLKHEVLPEIRKTGSYQSQPEAPKRITPQQLRELEARITQAAVSFSYRTKAENRIRNNVRHLCGISNIADVPPEQYQRALALIERSNQIGGQYAGMLCELEGKVLSELVGYGLPLTPELRKQYRAEFDVDLPRHVDWGVVQAELDGSRLLAQQCGH